MPFSTLISKKSRLLLALIIALQLLLLGYYMNKKSGFFLDEVYSYTLSNSQVGVLFFAIGMDEKPSFNCWNKWIDAKSLSDNYLTVPSSNRFNYSNTYVNMTSDTHPPLYHYLMHSICSFFPGEFSKWFGLIPNMVFFLLTQVLLFFVARQFCSEKGSLLVCLAYGFSAACISNFIYIRMYAMVTVCYLALLYLFLLISDFNITLKKALLLFAVTFVGSLTHYHFLAYAFFITLVFIIICLMNKQKKCFWLVSISVLLGVIAAYIVFPETANQLAKSPRANEVRSFAGNIFPVLSGFAFAIAKQFGISLTKSLYIAGGVLLSYLIFSFAYIIGKSSLKEYSIKLMVIVLPVVLFLFLISPTIGYNILGYVLSYRFFTTVFPILLVIISFFLEKKLNNKYLVTFLILLSLISTVSGDSLPTLYPKQSESERIENLLLDKNILLYRFSDEFAQSAVLSLSKWKNVCYIPRNQREIPNFPKDKIKPDYIISSMGLEVSEANLEYVGEYEIRGIYFYVYSCHY